MAEWFHCKSGSQPTPGSSSWILSQRVEWLLLQTAFIYSRNICMLWNVSFGTKKHKAETVASKRLFADWELNAVRRWERHKALLWLPTSLCCGARSSWRHICSPCHLSFKNSFPLNSAWLVLFIQRHSQFASHERALITYSPKSTWLGLAALLILAPHSKHPPEPGLYVLASLLDPLFLLTVMVLIFACSVWSL